MPFLPQSSANRRNHSWKQNGESYDSAKILFGLLQDTFKTNPQKTFSKNLLIFLYPRNPLFIFTHPLEILDNPSEYNDFLHVYFLTKVRRGKTVQQ
jgi:hypothetical protein